MNLPKIISLILIVLMCSYALFLYSRPVFTPPGDKKTNTLLPTPTPASPVTLAFVPSSLTLTTQQQEVSLVLNTGETPISEAQVEIQYDPSYVLVTAVSPNDFFPNPLLPLTENNQLRGRIFYALSIPVNGTEKKGKGSLITLSLSRTLSASESGRSVIRFLPKTGVHSSSQKSPLPLTTKNLTLFFESTSPPASPSL